LKLCWQENEMMRGSGIFARRKSTALLIVLTCALAFSSAAEAKNAPQSIAVIDSAMANSGRLKNKVVYVDFWASWCAPCRRSLPWMKQLLDKYGKSGLQLVAINVDRKPSAGKAFLEQLNSPLQTVTDSAASWNRLSNSVIFDSSGTLAKIYNLEALPTSFIYGRDGTLRKQHQGFAENDTLYLDSLLTSLLAEK
jgi:thiol-disulfide isomerase/thioredoxin